MTLARWLTSWSLPTASAKLKTDKIDSEILAQLLRCDLIQQAWAPARIVQSLKAWTSKELRQKFAIIRQTRPETEDFWASSYYCGTAGHVSAEVVAKYIRENSGKF